MGKSRICMKTITSIALSVVLALGLLPAQAFAEVGDAATAAIPQAVSTSTRDDASSVEPSIDPSIGSEGVDDLEESYSAESGENAFTPEEADEGNQASDSSFASPEGEEGIAPEAAEGSGFGTLAVNSYAVLYDSDGDGTGDKLVFQSSTLNLSKYGAKVSSWQFAAEQTKFTSSSPAPWYDARSTVKSAVFNNPLSPTSLAYWFYGMSSLESVDLSNLDASGVKSMSHMFDGCSSLASLDVSSFDTSGAVGMSRMFSGCSKLALLDVSSFDTSRVTDMSDMFHGCSSLSSLDVSSFDTSNVWGMKGMFNGCSELASLDLSSFSTWLVSNLSDMFSGCSSLKSLDLSSFDTSYVLRMNDMFNGCSSLTSLDLSSFDTSRTGEMVSIFSGCLSLRTVKLGAGFTFTGRWTGRICNLPAISDLNGYTGLWVSSADGEAYKPNAIPNNVAAVYTAQQKPGVVMGDISSAIVSDIPEQTCTGSRIEPEVEVTLDGKTLVRGVDFRVSCTNNIKVGTATATIIGIGDYEGVIRKHFSIKKAPTPIFADVDYSSWYGDAVTFVAEKDLVTGYSDSGLFGVGNALTRAQLATILYRNANPDASPDFRPRNTTGMPDVEGFTWYTAGVNWAVENGVINGYADGEGNRVAFGPDDSMTLEQLVTAIANLSADEEDLPGTGETAAILRPFRDRWSVSPWARPSMAWAAQKGLVAGYDEPDGKHLRPSENISRERAVVILMRAFELGILE